MQLHTPTNDLIEIQSYSPLNGFIPLQGDKTVSVHTLLALIFFPNTKFEIFDLPHCKDVQYVIDWMINNNLGYINRTNNSLQLFFDKLPEITDITSINLIRSSICLLTPLSLLNGKLRFTDIGGCNFSVRPYDHHIALANQLGIEVVKREDCLEASKKRNEKYVQFDCSINGLYSVGVTAHAIISSLVFEGELFLTSVAIDPSVTFLIQLIRHRHEVQFDQDKRTLLIRYKNKKVDKIVLLIPLDLTVAITYVSAVMPTKGILEINGLQILPYWFKNLMSDLNIDIEQKPNSISFSTSCLKNPKAIICSPYPGVPTDCGPILTSLLCNIEGKCIIKDEVYKARQSHIHSLKLMGYNVNFSSSTSFTKGKIPNRKSLLLTANDIRAGAATLVAALNRKAVTKISNSKEISRGYDGIVENLRSLNAKIIYVK